MQIYDNSEYIINCHLCTSDWCPFKQLNHQAELSLVFKSPILNIIYTPYGVKDWYVEFSRSLFFNLCGGLSWNENRNVVCNQITHTMNDTFRKPSVKYFVCSLRENNHKSEPNAMYANTEPALLYGNLCDIP